MEVDYLEQQEIGIPNTKAHPARNERVTVATIQVALQECDLPVAKRTLLEPPLQGLFVLVEQVRGPMIAGRKRTLWIIESEKSEEVVFRVIIYPQVNEETSL